MKASAAKVNGNWRDVYKDPVTDRVGTGTEGFWDADPEDENDVAGTLVLPANHSDATSDNTGQAHPWATSL